MTERYVVAMTGASGAIFGIRLLERLGLLGMETHLIISAWAAKTIQHETQYEVKDVQALADVVYRPGDQAAAISSGSFRTAGMFVAPCSVKMVAAIASGYANDLVARSADVTLKERRRLVLLVRESPLSEIHLENMLKLARIGVSIVPPVPAFYNHPSSLDEMVDHVVTRALDQVGLHSDMTPRWDGRLRPSRSVEADGRPY